MDSDMKSCIQDVLKLTSGQKLIDYLLDHCLLSSQTFSPGNPYQTSFNEGKRHVGLHIVALLDESEASLVKKSYKRAKTKHLQGKHNV